MPRTEKCIPYAKLTWLKEFESGTKIYFKIRIKTSDLEDDTNPDDVLQFSIEFKKNI